MLLDCIVIGVGGFIGSVLRYLISKLPLNNLYNFPFATFIVNILGAFFIGVLMQLVIVKLDTNDRVVLFLKTGICGGFTTFSTFVAEGVTLVQGGKTAISVVYIILTILFGILSFIAGQFLVKIIFKAYL